MHLIDSEKLIARLSVRCERLSRDFSAKKLDASEYHARRLENVIVLEAVRDMVNNGSEAVKHAHFIVGTANAHDGRERPAGACSNCRKTYIAKFNSNMFGWRFCPNCGARLDEPKRNVFNA